MYAREAGNTVLNPESFLRGRYRAQEELLLSSKRELENLKHVFDIHADEVVLRRRIDGGSEGAFGEVGCPTEHRIKAFALTGPPRFYVWRRSGWRTGTTGRWR